MNKNKFISLCMAGVMAVSALPTATFAASVGSDATNPAIGEDTAQNAKTQYSTIGMNDAQTEVYLTVDDSDLIASLPTTVILDGTPNAKGEYIGKYSVGVSGNMSGDKVVTIEPENENVSLKQKGKDDKTASIEQQKTMFTTDDFASNTKTTGTITAESLTAGSWNGSFNFNIRKETNTSYLNVLATKTMYSYQGGIKYASSPIYEKFYDGLDNDDKKRNIANTGLFDIMPIEALGLNVGDTITIRNDSPTYRYTCVFGNEYMNKVANVPWIYPTKETTFTIPETAVGLGLSATIDYSKEFLPTELDLNNLHIYKADGEEIDFLSLLAKYATEDETPASLNNYPSLGHNFDTQFEQKLAQQFGLAMIDVDTIFTKDNVALNTHTLNVTINGETKKVSDVTYQELIDNGYNFRLIDDVLNDVDVNKITLYLDLKQETTTSAKQIVDYIEQHNLDTRCFVGNLYVKILSYIHTLNPNISLWCYENVDNEWTEENIEALKSLKEKNMVAISINSKSNDFNKIKDFAKEFDIVSSNIVTAASESQTKVINLRDIVEYCDTNPGNCICSANVGAVVRNDLLYSRWKNTFIK